MAMRWRLCERGTRKSERGTDAPLPFRAPRSALREGLLFEFRIEATNGTARAGQLSLPHGEVQTPCFMPVGTQGTVRTLSPNDLRAAGASLVLANTYHLHVRPGEDVVGRLGGSRRFLTPERAVEIQWALGADVAMAFDHVVPGGADEATARDALERTLKWLERCARRHGELSDGPTVQQTLWPILQGAAHSQLRIEGLRRILDKAEWTGLAVGGLSVGEPKAVMYETLERLEPRLPPAVPRYLMGVGFPEDLVAAVARGVDLFDCVAPTRNGRNGTAYTADGPLNIRNAAHREDPRPLDSTCDCETCTTFSRGYLRHLFAAEELLGLRLLSLHNVRYLIRLTAELRAAIQGGAGDYARWAAEWRRRYTQGETT